MYIYYVAIGSRAQECNYQLRLKHVTVHPGFMCMYLAIDTADELEESGLCVAVSNLRII